MNGNSIARRLQRRTGLDRAACQATLDVLQRAGFARRHVQPEEDALLVLRRVGRDPRYASLKQKTEAARDGAVVLRARHCLIRGNAFECMNEIHDAFHTGILSIRPLLNAGIGPGLGAEKREVVILDVLGSIWIEALSGGSLFDHLLAYPDDLDPRKSFCLATYAAGIARNTKRTSNERNRRQDFFEKTWTTYAANPSTCMTAWVRNAGISVRDAIAGIHVPVRRRDGKAEVERKARKLGNVVGRMASTATGTAPATPADELEAWERKEIDAQLLRIVTAFANRTFGKKALGVYMHTLRGALSDRTAAGKLGIRCCKCRRALADSTCRKCVRALHTHRYLNVRRIRLFTAFVIFEQSIDQIASFLNEVPRAVEDALHGARIDRAEWAAEEPWLRKIRRTYDPHDCLAGLRPRQRREPAAGRAPSTSALRARVPVCATSNSMSRAFTN